MSVRQSINENFHKIKLSGRDLILILLFFLFSLLSFQLGVLQGAQIKQKPVTLSTQELRQITPNASVKLVLVSKKGRKYYYFWCSGARNVKEENRIYFKDAEEAERRGYSLSKTCVKSI